MNDRLGRIWKWSWPNRGTLPDVSLEEMNRTMKNYSQDSQYPAQIRTKPLPNTTTTLVSAGCRSWLVSVTEQRTTTTSSMASHTNAGNRAVARPLPALQNKKFWEEQIGSGKLLLAFANIVFPGSGSGGTHYHIFPSHDSGSCATACYRMN
jgi:hypothetical protein